MKRINILYIIGILLVILVLQLNRYHGKQTLLFYGFAENKEMDISLDHSITINEIFVTPGQKVKQGTLLATVSRNTLDLKFNSLSHEIAELETREEIWKADLLSDINKLRAQKISKESEINSDIAQLRAEIEFNEGLVKDLKSVSVKEGTTDKKSSRLLKIEALEKELELSVKPLEIEINRLQASLNNQDHPIKIQKEKLKDEVKFLETEQEKLSLTAPADGVVGSVNCKEGENLNSFSTIVTFYNQKPTLVKAYVLESLILQVSLGDSLTVISTLHPEHSCGGEVIGLGSRIVEIPERLRKLPEYKTYGREVLVSIPSSNHFLQKEKVMLNLMPTEENGGTGFFNPLFNYSTKKVESARE
jgi:multidrug resistance efflux pump